MKQYNELVRHILGHGTEREDRTGTGTVSVFGYQMRFNLDEGFPLLTTKKVHFKSVVHELLWMLRGETNVKSLQEAGVTIWDEWADENGDLGPVYGAQWRYAMQRDQVLDVLHQLETNPTSRRMVVSAWNPADLDAQRLPPCHLLWQLYAQDGRLSLQVYQRSADVGLGVPFNVASYALLIHLICALYPEKYRPGDLIWTGGDVHIYKDHLDALRMQITRKPFDLPRLRVRPRPDLADIAQFQPEDIELIGYECHPAIKMAVSA